ncbi:MAG: TetR/AcrR family transcriptional regulator [Microthrixaceae bacterium]|nr:TetR/AcrR family transcriptional regulator [Microthrixaceae bacterium]
MSVTRARTRNPRGEGDRLRADLLDAAAELIAEHRSVDRVSLRAVAAAAGVSPMAVYNHFDDKGELMVAAVQHCWDEFQAAIAAAYLAADTPEARLRDAGSAYVRFALEHPGKYRVLFSDPADLPERPEPVGLSAFDQLVEVVADVLARRGDRRDPVFVAVQVHTWIHGIVSLLACKPEGDWPPVEALLDELVVRLDLDAPAG